MGKVAMAAQRQKAVAEAAEPGCGSLPEASVGPGSSAVSPCHVMSSSRKARAGQAWPVGIVPGQRKLVAGVQGSHPECVCGWKGEVERRQGARGKARVVWTVGVSNTGGTLGLGPVPLWSLDLTEVEGKEGGQSVCAWSSICLQRHYDARAFRSAMWDQESVGRLKLYLHRYQATRTQAMPKNVQKTWREVLSHKPTPATEELSEHGAGRALGQVQTAGKGAPTN